MSYRNFNIERDNLELCKEQYAITNPHILPRELIAVVVYDKLDDRYYACIFVKASGISPRLLLKGPHDHYPNDAIKALLQLQSETIGNSVSQAVRTPQMGQKEWRAVHDHGARFTVCTTNGGERSSGASSARSTGTSQQAGNMDAPPAYWK